MSRNSRQPIIFVNVIYGAQGSPEVTKNLIALFRKNEKSNIPLL